jgi:large subunit ribosomal protein L28
MASKRKITQVKPGFGNNRSFSMRASRRTFAPNIQAKNIFVPSLGRSVRVKITVSELHTIDKIGLEAFLKRQGKTLEGIL